MQIYTFSVEKPRKITLFLSFLRFIFTLFLLLPFSHPMYQQGSSKLLLRKQPSSHITLAKVAKCDDYFFSSMTMFLGKNSRTLQKCSKPSAEPNLLVLCRGAAHFRYNFATAKLQSSTKQLIIKNNTTFHITDQTKPSST